MCSRERWAIVMIIKMPIAIVTTWRIRDLRQLCHAWLLFSYNTSHILIAPAYINKKKYFVYKMLIKTF